MVRNDGRHRDLSLPSRPTVTKDKERDNLSLSMGSKSSRSSRSSRSKRTIKKVCTRMRSAMCLEPGSTSERQTLPTWSERRMESPELWGNLSDATRDLPPAATHSLSSEGSEVDRVVLGTFLKVSNQVTDQIKVADEQYTRGELDKAIRSYRSALRLLTTQQNVDLPFGDSSAGESLSRNKNNYAKRYVACRTLIKVGVIHHKRGNCENALNTLNKALQLAKTVRDLGLREKVDGVRLDDLETDCHLHAFMLSADILKEHAVVHLAEQEFDRALERHEAEVLMRRVGLEYAMKGDTSGGNHPQIIRLKLKVADTLKNIGMINEKWGKYQDSIEAYDEALKLRREVYPDPFHESCPAEMLDVLFNLGSVYSEMGERHEISLRYFLELNRLLRRKIGSRHADVAAALTGIGKAYMNLGKFDKSLKALTGARLIFDSTKEWGKRSDDERTILIADTLSAAGSVYQKTKMLDEAKESLTEAIDLQNSVLDPQDPNLAKTKNSLGTVLALEGDYSSSLRLHRDALRTFKTSSSRDQYFRDAGYSHTYIGVAKKGTGDMKGAMQHFKAARRKFLEAGVSADNEELQLATRYLSDFEYLCAKATLMNEGLVNDYDSLVSADSASSHGSASRLRF